MKIFKNNTTNKNSIDEIPSNEKSGSRSKINIVSVIGVIVLLLVTGIVAMLGYRVIATAGEVPGKLTSISVAANNLNYSSNTIKKAQKVDYNTMRYGFMDDLMLAQMDRWDKQYDDQRMEEIRAINDLTAMSLKTADRVAYEQLKKQREEEAEKAIELAAKAEEEKQLKIRAMVDAILNPPDQNVFIDTGDGTDTGTGDTASRGGKKGKPVYATTHGKSLGKFVITAYCTCKICCGIYSGNNRTASGTVPTSNRTIAVDTNVIPFGTRVVINGQVYVAEDRGGAIKGKRIDMFYMTHKEALRWGKRTFEVFLAE